ncbi:MAG TPA: oxygenase MpaB family protein [Solirubrobacteraceae bacterium]|nr:oxygenase MpaB family protein [Solirubrobacteraceae bacterium]
MSRTTAAGTLLGANSVSWHYTGDWRLGLVLARALLLQVCHPTIGAGVAEHSIFREDPWGRLRQSLDPVLETVYAADGAKVGARIRAAHRAIRGTDARGRRYSAWEPEAYWFVLASGMESIVVMAERYFARPMTRAERERLLAETREIGVRMGLRERDMPATLRDFEESYETLLRERLEDHPTAHSVLEEIASSPPPPWLPLPGPLRLSFSLPVAHVMTLATVGTLPAVVRERLGIGWSALDEYRLRALAAAVRSAFAAMPAQWRYMPIARAGFQREARAARAA